MSDPGLLAALSALPHFRLLAPDLLERIGASARRRVLQAGELVFREGEPCAAFFVVEAGGVKLYRTTPDGREQVVHNLSRGSTFAEAAVLSMRRYPVTAAATESPTGLIEIGAEPFVALFREDARLAPAVVSSLCMRLVSLVERVEELSLLHAGSRLARYLLRQPATGPRDRARIELSLTKKELAAHLSMTPETLSRLLRRWADRGWIASERTAITVLDSPRLLRLADGEEG